MDFNSAIGRKRMAEAQAQSQQKNFVVPSQEFESTEFDNFEDEALQQEMMKREIEKARSLKNSGRERVSDVGRKRIEILSGIGREMRSVSIGGSNFVLRTLKSGEKKAVLKRLIEDQHKVEIMSSMALMQYMLAYSLYSIDDQLVDDVFSKNFEDRCAVVDNLDEYVFRKLYDELIKLQTEVETKLGLINKFEDEKEKQAFENEVSKDLKE